MRILLLTINLWIGVEIPVASAQSCAVELEKMNVVFVGGVTNYLSVAISDLPDSMVTVTPSFGTLLRTGSGDYEWKICARDSAIATLTVRDNVRDTLISIRHYRVKRPPEPVPTLGRWHHSINPWGDFKDRSEIALYLENFDYEIQCKTVSFEMMYLKKGEDASPVIFNSGRLLNERVRSFVQRATPGDEYHFFNFRYTCGCDPLVRRLDEELRFRIK